jgi:thiol-disulfide isomerase/thioredoxin
VTYLIAAVAVLAVLTVLNMLLLLGVIRRLRKMATRQSAPLTISDGLPIGASLPSFAATTVDGEPISQDLLSGHALIGFFSPTCPPCQELLPQFIARARLDPGDALAVVVTDTAEEAGDDVARLREVARVVVEEPSGPLQRALKADGFPTVYVLGPDRTVLSHDLPDPLPTSR